MKSIHGHEVMQLISNNKSPSSKNELVAQIETAFGETARFHTCSAKNLSAAQLIDCIVARGKFEGSEDALTLDAAKICHH